MKGYKMATATATATKPRAKSLKTPRFRVSFESVFEKSAYGTSTPAWSLTGLFYPKQFTEDEKAKWNAIKAQLDVVSKETFKKGWRELDRGLYKTPYHKGDEKSYEGYGDPNMIYFRMASALRRPGIVDLSNQPITIENREEFYSGCWARATVNVFANLKWKSLSIGLGNLQKIKDDTSFMGGTSAEEDFGGDAEAEFGGAEAASDDFEVGGTTVAAEDDDDPTA
jgi:hypothetical protein